MVTPELRREAAQVMESKGMSRYKACKFARVPRSALYAPPSVPDDGFDRNTVLELARNYQRLGYRMLHAIYRNNGGTMNHKRFYRIYKEESLGLRRRRRKKVFRERVPLEHPLEAGIRWSMDFVFDRCENGRQLKILTLVDDFSKEALWMEVGHGISGRALCQVLETVCLIHGAPESIRSDNGPEFTSRHFGLWMMSKGIKHDFIQPGKPTQNAFVESFNGKFREECLNANLFLDLEHAQTVIEQWRNFYNEIRPHSSLGMIAPKEFVARFSTEDSYS